MNGQLDPNVYDDEAFIGTEDGEIDGNVMDDLNDEDAEAFEDDEDDDATDNEQGGAVVSNAALAEERQSFRDNGILSNSTLGTVQEHEQFSGSDDEAMGSARHAVLPDASIWTSRYHTDAVMAVAWSPDGQQLATGGCDDSAYVHRWQAKEDQPARLAGHKDTVAVVAYDPQGKLVATGSMDGSVRLWHTGTGQHAGTLEGPTEPVVFLHWHPRGSVLLVGSEDMMAWMFNAEKQQCMHVFSGHSGPVVGGGFTPDGRTVVTVGGEADGSVRVWDPKSGECTATIAAGHNSHSEEGATCLAFAPDGAVVATGGVKGEVVLSNVATGKAVARLSEHTDSIEGVAFAHELQLLATASLDGTVIVWDAGQRTRRGICQHPSGVVSIVMQHRGPLFATACLDGGVRVYDVRTAELVGTYGGHEAAVQAVAWAPDDRHILSGSDDFTVRLFAA